MENSLYSWFFPMIKGVFTATAEMWSWLTTPIMGTNISPLSLFGVGTILAIVTAIIIKEALL